LADFLLNYEALLTDIKHSEMTDKDKVSADIHVLANQNCSSISSRVKDKQRAHWVAPPNGKVTINVDAAYLPATRDAAVGAVAREHDGTIIAALSQTTGFCQDAEEAYRRAILAGLWMGN
jgi:hypothetical protein